jgi:prepilin-type N-terminal cleavage/methylation domain-containing protein
VTERRVSPDRGFTLLETIVVVLLVAVLSSVIVAVVAVILRNVPATEARVDDSRSYQSLVTWLPRDAASTEPDEFAIVSEPLSSTPWDCSGVTGTSLVRMSSEHDGTAYVADYRLVDAGNGKRVKRYTCFGPSATPTFAVAGNRNMTSVIHDADAVSVKQESKTVGVVIRLTTCAPTNCTLPGSMISVEAGSRNLDEPLS